MSCSLNETAPRDGGRRRRRRRFFPAPDVWKTETEAVIVGGRATERYIKQQCVRLCALRSISEGSDVESTSVLARALTLTKIHLELPAVSTVGTPWSHNDDAMWNDAGLHLVPHVRSRSVRSSHAPRLAVPWTRTVFLPVVLSLSRHRPFGTHCQKMVSILKPWQLLESDWELTFSGASCETFLPPTASEFFIMALYKFFYSFIHSFIQCATDYDRCHAIVTGTEKKIRLNFANCFTIFPGKNCRGAMSRVSSKGCYKWKVNFFYFAILLELLFVSDKTCELLAVCISVCRSIWHDDNKQHVLHWNVASKTFRQWAALF